MKDLLGDEFYASTYPATPGWTEPTTSRDAALKIAPHAPTLRDEVLRVVRAAGARGLTADEAGDLLKKPWTAIRPRLTELGPKYLNKIRRNGERRKNESGCKAAVWVAVMESRS